MRRHLRRVLTAISCSLLVALGAQATGCFYGPPGNVPSPEGVPSVVSRELDDIKVHVVNTGWVRVKQVHRELEGPAALRLPAIAFSREWTEPMPILVGVIEHPDGVFLVDTGLSETSLEPAHYECDPGTGFVYHNLLDFRFSPEQRVDRRLAELGIDMARVKGVVLTHRHADHTEGLPHIPATASVYVGTGDWPRHQGSLDCRWPKGIEPVTVPSDTGAPFEAFPHSRPLTSDGRVSIVPLTGHTPGHLAVAVRTSRGTVLFAGDAAFSVRQIRERKIAGIVEAPDEARASLDRLAAQLETFPTFLVPAHEPRLLARFARGERTLLEPN